MTLATVSRGSVKQKRSTAAKKRRLKDKKMKKAKKVKLEKQNGIIQRQRKELETRKALEESAHVKHELELYKIAYGNAKLKLKQMQFQTVSVTPFSVKCKNRLTASALCKEDKLSFLASRQRSCPHLSESVVKFPVSEVILGEGVYGKVKVAHFMTLNIPIAIKIGKNTSFSALSEARILQRLSGNQCFPYVFGVFNNMLAMELVAKHDGSKYVPLTLHEKVNQKDYPPHSYWLSICYQLSKAVHYMHGCGILHNDLKGDNVLLQERDDFCVPKITDFGKATHVHNPAVYSLTEKEKTIYNTKHRHLAFELRNIPNTKQCTMTDIYSLGRQIKIIGYSVNIEHLKNIGLRMMNKEPCKRPNLIEVSKELSVLL